MTDNTQRGDTAKQCVQQYEWNQDSKQPPLRSTLQATISIIAISLLAVLLGCSDYQDGYDAYKRGNYPTALKKLRPLAERGNPKAQFRLGWMYGHGEGVIQNDEEAVEWYQKAAQQDHVIAQFNLGTRYATGKGVIQAEEEAVKWHEKAIEQGPAGDQVILGIRYVNGAGVAQDYGKALKCIRKAVEQGSTIAQLHLGSMYEFGMGVDRNYVTAYMWYHRAGILGIEGAHEERDKIVKKMTIVQIAEAQRLAREWKLKKTD